MYINYKGQKVEFVSKEERIDEFFTILGMENRPAWSVLESDDGEHCVTELGCDVAVSADAIIGDTITVKEFSELMYDLISIIPAGGRLENNKLSMHDAIAFFKENMFTESQRDLQRKFAEFLETHGSPIDQEKGKPESSTHVGEILDLSIPYKGTRK